MIRVAVTTGSLRLNQALRSLLKERGRFEILTSDASFDEFGRRDGEMSAAAEGEISSATDQGDIGAADRYEPAHSPIMWGCSVQGASGWINQLAFEDNTFR